MTAAPQSQPRLRGLDSLRGIAALSVVLFHFTTGYVHRIGPFPTPPLFYFPYGHLGVELFFCISGFVILQTIERTADPRRFAVARIARIYPAYLICCPISWLIRYPAHFALLPLTPFVIASNASMLSGLTGSPEADPSYWTLSFEILFYIGAMTVWSLLGEPKRMERFCAVWLAVSWLARLIPAVYTHRRLCFLLDVPYANFFVIGMMIYYLTRNPVRMPAGFVLVPALIMSFLPNESNLPTSFYGALTFAFALALWLVAKTQGRFLAFQPLVFLGEVSYSLYLIHQIVGQYLMHLLLNAGVPTNAAILAAILAMTGLAFLIRTFVEKPAERRIKAWDKGRNQIPTSQGLANPAVKAAA